MTICKREAGPEGLCLIVSKAIDTQIMLGPRGQEPEVPQENQNAPPPPREPVAPQYVQPALDVGNAALPPREAVNRRPPDNLVDRGDQRIAAFFRENGEVLATQARRLAAIPFAGASIPYPGDDVVIEQLVREAWGKPEAYYHWQAALGEDPATAAVELAAATVYNYAFRADPDVAAQTSVFPAAMFLASMNDFSAQIEAFRQNRIIVAMSAEITRRYNAARAADPDNAPEGPGNLLPARARVDLDNAEAIRTTAMELAVVSAFLGINDTVGNSDIRRMCERFVNRIVEIQEIDVQQNSLLGKIRAAYAGRVDIAGNQGSRTEALRQAVSSALVKGRSDFAKALFFATIGSYFVSGCLTDSPAGILGNRFSYSLMNLAALPIRQHQKLRSRLLGHTQSEHENYISAVTGSQISGSFDELSPVVLRAWAFGIAPLCSFSQGGAQVARDLIAFFNMADHNVANTTTLLAPFCRYFNQSYYSSLGTSTHNGAVYKAVVAFITRQGQTFQITVTDTITTRSTMYTFVYRFYKFLYLAASILPPTEAELEWLNVTNLRDEAFAQLTRVVVAIPNANGLEALGGLAGGNAVPQEAEGDEQVQDGEGVDL